MGGPGPFATPMGVARMYRSVPSVTLAEDQPFSLVAAGCVDIRES
ncbi:hypothetical protein ACHBTE_31645 [Streptomyces sp. M41]